ncbi:PrpF domain-containing protein [Sinomonas soli]
MEELNGTVEVAAAWVRGGTSKCWIFAAEAVDAAPLALETLLENALGAGDARQIDGVGGATSTTSKIAVVARSEHAGADVDYLFGQVGIADRVVEWGSNCGNCATAVGLYAVQEGLVPLGAEQTTVRLRNVNTGAILRTSVPTPGGRAPERGDAHVPGVASGGIPVDLTFEGPFTRDRAFPTGRTSEAVRAGGRTGEATIVSAGAPALLLDAAGLGLTGAEVIAELTERVPMLTPFRAEGAVLHGIIAPGEPAPNAVPKTGVVGPARDYVASDGSAVAAGEYDVSVRMLSMHAPHPAIGLTSAVAVAVAAATPGTVVSRYLPADTRTVRIGTASGVVEASWTTAPDGTVEAVSLHRAARRLATAVLHVPTAGAAGQPVAPAEGAQHRPAAAPLAVPA